MADVAVLVNKMVRDGQTEGFGTVALNTWSTAIGGMTTGNTYLIPFDNDDKLGFFMSWNACETDTAYAIGVRVYLGDSWRSGGGGATVAHTTETGKLPFEPFVLWTTSSGRQAWMFGPFESAKFGTLSTTTSYGAHLNEQYLKVGFVDSSSSGGGHGWNTGELGSSGASATVALDAPLIRAFVWPSVVYSS